MTAILEQNALSDAVVNRKTFAQKNRIKSVDGNRNTPKNKRDVTLRMSPRDVCPAAAVVVSWKLSTNYWTRLYCTIDPGVTSARSPTILFSNLLNITCNFQDTSVPGYAIWRGKQGNLCASTNTSPSPTSASNTTGPYRKPQDHHRPSPS